MMEPNLPQIAKWFDGFKIECRKSLYPIIYELRDLVCYDKH